MMKCGEPLPPTKPRTRRNVSMATIDLLVSIWPVPNQP
jgi:hypothetical protein